MNNEQTIQILGLLQTMQEACLELYGSVQAENGPALQQLYADMESGLLHMLDAAATADTPGNKKLSAACYSVLDSLRRIKGGKDKAVRLQKIEFELLPLLQEAYLTWYFFQFLAEHPEHLQEYYDKDKALLCANSYIDEALERGQYKYEVSFFVLAYNKLEYTKQCVESLLANIPKGLNYELILVNHGSSDGTKEYFESIHPHKQLDIAVNGGGMGAVARILEGEFTIMISNDVIVTPHAIENLLTCIRSDPQIAWVVPAVPNTSNWQSISADYTTVAGLMDFAQQNNKSDSMRWEQRARLCNPIDIRRNSVFYSSGGLCLNGAYHTLHPTYAVSFPDDRASLLLRRNGYKMMLAKDAYCHHFGSVTLKDEIRQKNEDQYYQEGGQEFFKAFHVNPWGAGASYDRAFLKRVVGEESGHTEVLGINCGLGSNSLKIKEQVREYCRNPDVRLYNITSSPEYLRDLEGISDEALTIQKREAFEAFLAGKLFSYVVWEQEFLPDISAGTLMRSLRDVLCPGGRLIVQKTAQTKKHLTAETGWKKLGDSWYTWQKDGKG